MFIYLPMLALRSRRLAFFSAANPSIYSSGLGVESKYGTIQKIPARFRPKTVLAPAGISFATIKAKIAQEEITYPLIAKPDVGYRGFLVRKIKSELELEEYLQEYPINFIIQEFIDYPEEVGVLYYRFPDETVGRVSSITLKEFLSIEGDGVSTVLELIQNKPRAILQLDRLKDTHRGILDQVPEQGQRVPLGVVGNHSKGTTFINGNHLIDEEISNTFDQISKEIDGFYYGRYDIKCHSFEDLKKGQNLKIIEINGVCSEPTHIYDPQRTTYFRAVRDILKYWTIIRKISVANHKLGAPYMGNMELVKVMINLGLYFRMIKKDLIPKENPKAQPAYSTGNSSK